MRKAPERGASLLEGITFWSVNPQGPAHAACLGVEIARVSDAGASRCVASAFRYGNMWKIVRGLYLPSSLVLVIIAQFGTAVVPIGC